jgi:pimeloyl-ACP methyl ester carboxylesterase
MLFLQGTKDPFATPAVLGPVLAKLPRASLHAVEGGGHSLERSRKDDARETAASFAPLVARFMRGEPV